MQKFRIISLKVAFSQTFVEGGVAFFSVFQTPSVFAKVLKTVNFFRKSSISCMYSWVPNTPLEGFVQNPPRKELAIAHVKKCLTTIAWQNYH